MKNKSEELGLHGEKRRDRQAHGKGSMQDSRLCRVFVKRTRDRGPLEQDCRLRRVERTRDRELKTQDPQIVGEAEGNVVTVSSLYNYVCCSVDIKGDWRVEQAW